MKVKADCGRCMAYRKLYKHMAKCKECSETGARKLNSISKTPETSAFKKRGR